MQKPALVVLTTHFGCNFSGGSTATCEIFTRLQSHFAKVVVIGTELGEHSFDRLEFKPYSNLRDARQILQTIKPDSAVFYGDFYNASVLANSALPFYFTYHDNWPELGQLSIRYRIQCLYYWSVYKQIFTRARHVFAVSQLKLRQVSQFTSNVSLVRNGVAQPSHIDQSPDRHWQDWGWQDPGWQDRARRKNVLMVGNLDRRKYAKAVQLFRHLPAHPGFIIDIYGHINDRRLARQLRRYDFVRLKGYHTTIPYQTYRVLLHTSLMENLSIVWCEAILHKLPIVAFDVGAAQEVITPDRGICISNYSLDSMRGALLATYSATNSTTHHSEVITPSLDRFKREYNWDRAADDYAKVMCSQDYF